MENSKICNDEYKQTLTHLYNMLSCPETLQDRKNNLLIYLKMLAIAKYNDDKCIIKGLENKIKNLKKEIENEEQEIYNVLFSEDRI